METAVIATRTKPYPQTQKKTIHVTDVSRLTPKIARMLAKTCFPADTHVEVWDLDNKFGYRIYGKSTRKLKW